MAQLSGSPLWRLVTDPVRLLCAANLVTGSGGHASLLLTDLDFQRFSPTHASPASLVYQPPGHLSTFVSITNLIAS